MFSFAVGYNNFNTPNKKFELYGVPFEAIGGGADLNKTFTGLTPVEINWDLPNYTEFTDRAPQLQIWNGENYSFAYFVSNAWYEDANGEHYDGCGWCDGEGLFYTGDYSFEITPGYAYWVYYPIDDGKNLNVAGEVKTALQVQQTCEIPAKWMLLGNPYPVDTPLHNVSAMAVTGVTPVEINWDLPNYTEFTERAPQIQFWNGEGYSYAYFVSNAWYEDAQGEHYDGCGWCDGEGLFYTEDYPGVIPAAMGFWIRPMTSACTFTFKNPIK